MKTDIAIFKRLKSFLTELKQKRSLKNRVILGSLWLGAGSSAEQGLRFLRNMILTRLLVPEVFGVMAILLAVKMATETFTDVGIKKAIIQHPKGDEQTYLNGAWWLAFTRGLLLYCVAYSCSPWISDFYDNPELLPLMRVGFLSLIFDGAMSARAYVAAKQMNFKRWVIIFHGGGTCGVLSAIFLAIMFQNIWALVLGLIIEAVARCILSHIVCPFLPTFTFEKESLKALLRYAKGMFGLGFLYFIYMKVDIFVIGKLCTRADLGAYSMAVALAQIPFQLIAALMGQMAMPAFSEMQTDNERINKSIMNITKLIAYICFPLLFFVILNGRELLSLIYGPQYAKVAVPFAIIFGSWLIRFCGIPIGELYYALGRPELQRLFTAIRAIIILLLIYPAVKWFGLKGGALAGLFSMAVGYVLQVIRLKTITQLNLKQYSSILLRALIISLSVVVTWVATHNFFSINNFLSILPGILGCLFAYGIASWTLFRSYKEITSAKQ